MKGRQKALKTGRFVVGLTVLFALTLGREVASCAAVRVRTVAELLLDRRQSVDVRICWAGVRGGGGWAWSRLGGAGGGARCQSHRVAEAGIIVVLRGP